MASPSVPNFTFSTTTRSNSVPSTFPKSPHHLPLKPTSKRTSFLALCGTFEAASRGLPMDQFFAQDGGTTNRRGEQGNRKLDAAHYEALLRGGEQVTSVLEEMVKLLEDMNMDEASEEVAVQLAAQGVIGKRVDQMESGFMMALDYMIQIAEKDQDDKRKSLLEMIKETVLSHLTKECPPHVQVIGLLCRTPQKESRHELLRRVAAGGGVFQSENNTKVHLPGANLNDIANQADDLLETMESRPVVPDRKLLARLVLIREEARNMMGGGILDERNDRGLNILPESEVNFLTKLVALRPGRTVREMIKSVMQGKDEGADSSEGDESIIGEKTSGIAGKASVTGCKALPVRPGMFLETVSKVLGGIYAGNVSGITAQHLEWVHQNTLQILEEIAF
ncbi:protein PEP-RELATED DEVELOPMENT ARRESTED 1, chloroplastic [Olea europaea var. sylvestris]|uniref:Protein PEP-RELATED DEVELOPMENT ARRESTED 1, chloroplastic n=1 Tax=Olea europaea subsp. europaea TaxID=158383 RepID=A0A8S0TBL6_OLEEU|nr:protein PEP-RELATED DEVELOPMENT ARRESTED 1, chloroplastic [Olea europaea var. sylvestris]CAA3001431.1 Hypothetical predicted protein [Olea europaea subsp. europaea]